jgi:5-methylcytosine-specific restriction endonuclease McrA
MSRRYYANRRGREYYKEKAIIEKTSNKNLPAYIEDLGERLSRAFKKTSMSITARMEISPKIAEIDRKRSQLISDPNNCQFFGLLPKKNIPGLDTMDQERWRLQEELKGLTAQEVSEETKKDLLAAYDLARGRLEKINAQKKKAEALKEKAALVAEYQGKSRKVAKTVRNRLPINPECPYCGEKIGEEPHADHIYPVSKGGRSTIANMVYICRTCNINKREMTLREFISKFELNRDMIERNLESLGKSF